VHARAEKFAARILKSAADDRERLDFAYRLLFGRAAYAHEEAEAAEFRRQYSAACTDQPADKQTELAWAAYTRVLFASNELLHLD
jgi:hypothetical protein